MAGVTCQDCEPLMRVVQSFTHAHYMNALGSKESLMVFGVSERILLTFHSSPRYYSQKYNHIGFASIWHLAQTKQDANQSLCLELTRTRVGGNHSVGVAVNQKGLNYYSGEQEILKTMDLIKTMEEPMDEVLLSSVVEACVRIG